MVDDELKTKALSCFHNWKETVLIVSTVYDCTKCGIKKEDWEVIEKEDRDRMLKNWKRSQDYGGDTWD